MKILSILFLSVLSLISSGCVLGRISAEQDSLGFTKDEHGAGVQVSHRIEFFPK